MKQFKAFYTEDGQKQVKVFDAKNPEQVRVRLYTKAKEKEVPIIIHKVKVVK